MADARLSPAIARALARLHRFAVPAHLAPFFGAPTMWAQLWRWFEQAAAPATRAAIAGEGGGGARPARDARMYDEIDFAAGRAALTALQPVREIVYRSNPCRMRVCVVLGARVLIVAFAAALRVCS